MQHSCSIDKRDTGVFLGNEKKTKWVTIISFLTMVVEILAGYWTGSMALLADGWHMASHTLALGLSLLVYYLYRHPRFRSSFTFGGGKILALGGYTSAILLVGIALSMVGESLSRFYQKPTIRYEEALVVALVGLVVNMICAFIMHQGMAKHEEAPHCDHEHSPTHQKHSFVKTAEHHHHHHHHHEHGHHDHNHESAYVHIMTDALTSVFAIIALLLGHWQNWHWADPLVGVIGGLVVLKWSLGLIRESGKELLDAHDASIDRELLIKNLEADGSRVVDLHLWRLAPGQVGCELVIKPAQQQNSAYYRDVITRKFTIQHLIIEVV